MRVHIIETDSQFSGVMARFLEKNDCKVTRSGFSEMTIVPDADALVYDLDANVDPALKHLEKIIQEYPEIPVIVTTDTEDIKIGVGIIKAGAADCLVKPFLPDQLKHALTTAAARKKKQVDESVAVENEIPVTAETPPDENTSSEELLWTPGMEMLRTQADLIVRNTDMAFIYGEAGTGKKSLARYIHEQSNRRSAPFVIAEGITIMEHCERWIEQAKSGTLFIEKTEEVPQEVLSFLLNASRSNTRLMLSSTHSPETLSQKGDIDPMLLSGVEYDSIYLPPLRKRSGDILAFAHHFSTEACAELRKERMFFTSDAERDFMAYAWPGNLRELRNVVNRMVLLDSGGEAWRTAYFNFIKTGAGQMETEKVPETKASINLREASAKAEMDFILRMLEKVKFNKSAAARLMNISRRTLYNKLRMS
ncbi:MAG: sigma-54-dependent transcriptional regulator [Chitinophagaceae bacterium]